MMEKEVDPLFGEVPSEVALSRAPLVRVLAQVAFDPILVLRNEDVVAPFQNDIRSTYPKVVRETLRLPQSLFGGLEGHEEVIWRFQSPDAAWRVSVSPTYLAIETINYASRADLLSRTQDLVAAFNKVVGAVHVTRIGMRYVDQIKAPEMACLNELVRPEMLGIAQPPLAQSVKHALAETYCDTAEGGIIARWGALPPYGTHDPNVMSPIPGVSWFLDIDAFATPGGTGTEMDAHAICASADSLAKRVYAFFRWTVTSKFLDTYGRQL